MAQEPEGARWLDGKLDPEELRSALDFPARPQENPVPLRFRLKARRTGAAARAVPGPSGYEAMTHAIQALGARIDEMAATQAEMATVIEKLIETWATGTPAGVNVDNLVTVLQEITAREDRSAMIADALPAVIARLATLDARLESTAHSNGSDASALPDQATVDRLAGAIERLGTLIEPAPYTEGNGVREFAQLGDRFEAMLQRLEAGRARAATEGFSPRPASAPPVVRDSPSA